MQFASAIKLAGFFDLLDNMTHLQGHFKNFCLVAEDFDMRFSHLLLVLMLEYT